MFSWIRQGLRTGIVTTRYPVKPEQLPSDFRGRPVLDTERCLADQGCSACLAACLPGALSLTLAPTNGHRVQVEAATQLTLDYGRCIMCGLCVAACPEEALRMTPEYELATTTPGDLRQTARFLSAQERESEGQEEDQDEQDS